MKNLKNQKGITLVALVVTIIVLLILAGVSLSLVAGGNGILKRASSAVDTNSEATAKEQVALVIAEYQTEFYETVYVNQTESVNTNMGDWIATNKGGTSKNISTSDNYVFTITGDTAPYTVTIKGGGSETRLKTNITGQLSADGKLTWKVGSTSTGSGS